MARQSAPQSVSSNCLRLRPPVLCAGCPHRGMFYALSKNKITVLGGIGCYTLGSAASLSALHGFTKALGKESERKTVGVIGDSKFCHSGFTGLATIAYNQSNSTVIISRRPCVLLKEVKYSKTN